MLVYGDYGNSIPYDRLVLSRPGGPGDWMLTGSRQVKRRAGEECVTKKRDSDTGGRALDSGSGPSCPAPGYAYT